MADTAKSLTPQQEFVRQIGAGTGAMNQTREWQNGPVWSGSDIDISHSPTITWQNTTSAATYTSASSVLNS